MVFILLCRLFVVYQKYIYGEGGQERGMRGEDWRIRKGEMEVPFCSWKERRADCCLLLLEGVVGLRKKINEKLKREGGPKCIMESWILPFVIRGRCGVMNQETEEKWRKYEVKVNVHVFWVRIEVYMSVYLKNDIPEHRVNTKTRRTPRQSHWDKWKVEQ